MNKAIFCSLLSLMFLTAVSQVNNGLIARFTFNEGKPVNKVNGEMAKTVGASLVDDRFGNSKSAYYLHGNYGSYLNLGHKKNLKPDQGSISLWFKIDNPVLAGEGLEVNPIIITKSQAGDDFYEGYFIAYDYNLKKLVVTTTLSEKLQVTLHSNNEISLREWHHIVMTYDYNLLQVYLDGALENKMAKNFTSRFLENDSVMIGNSANTKNKRFLNGSVDDIDIYNRVLDTKEVQQLYAATDPQRYKTQLKWIIYSLIFIFSVFVVVFLISNYFKKELEKEKEKTKTLSHSYEQEIRVLKAQMNPHFIFNSLNTIQQFILVNDNEKAQLYLTKFSRLIRKILVSNTQDSISLTEEIEILKRYLEIESLRFNNVFTYNVTLHNIDEPRSIRIPHFLIQPFVENAIWHGLLPKSGDKILSLSFTKQDEKTISCVIEDNGVGRTKIKKNPANNKRSLAIGFIQQRLELLSKIVGEKYELEIIDKANETGEKIGTKVLIRIPILKNNEYA